MTPPCGRVRSVPVGTYRSVTVDTYGRVTGGSNPTTLAGFDPAGHDPNWIAIQWQGDHGWIEVHHGERVWLANISTVQPFIEIHEAFVPQVEPVPVE